jgi:hypothetical protein
MVKKLDKIYIKERIGFLNTLKFRTINQLISKIGDTQKGINYFNELKIHFRKQGYSNTQTKRMLGILLGEKKLGGLPTKFRLTPCVFKKDMLSAYKKYYPIYLTSLHPANYFTTLTKLSKDNSLYFDGVKFIIREHTVPTSNIHYRLFDDSGIEVRNSVLHSYGTKIQEFIQDTKYKTEDEKGLISSPLDFDLQMLKIPKIDKTLYLGVELEVGRKYNAPHDLVSNLIKDLNPNRIKKGTYEFAFIKSDSSIPSEVFGFEIVSAPATLAYHSTAWDRFFENSANYLRSYTVDKCGMHVHLSRAAFGADKCSSKLHQGKFVRFYNMASNKKFLEMIAGRVQNGYCTTQDSKKITKVVKVIKTTDKKKGVELVPQTSERNVAVNLSNTATLEVRIFKGNCKKEGFFKNIEFVHSTFYFTLQSGVSEKSLNYETYLKWLKEPSQKGTYPNLLKWLVAREEIEVKHINLTNKINKKTKGKQSLLKDYIQSVA